jgi:hypothetical protein
LRIGAPRVGQRARVGAAAVGVAAGLDMRLGARVDARETSLDRSFHALLLRSLGVPRSAAY